MGSSDNNDQDDLDKTEFEGPFKKRGCTDIICLIIFLAYVTGLVSDKK